MNIYGIGTDIVNINRIKNLLSKKNSSFKKGTALRANSSLYMRLDKIVNSNFSFKIDGAIF